jgi:ribosomal protein S4E
MVALNVIRRVEVVGTSSGLDETKTKLEALSRAQTTVGTTAEGMATKTETSARRQLSAASAYDRLLRSIDETYRAEQRYASGQAVLERALQQGQIGAAAYSRGLEMVAEKFGVVSLAAARQTAALERAAAVQARVNAMTGVSGGSDSAARAADVEAYGQALDRLQAKFDPMFAATQRYRSTLAEINDALRVGAISSEAATAARLKETAAYNGQVAAMERIAQVQKAVAQSAVNQQTIVPNRGADIAAYGKQLDDLRAKYSRLYAASRSYKDSLTEINEAARVGAISEAERAAAVMNTKVAFVQQVNSLRGVHDAQTIAAGSATKLGTAVGLNVHEWQNLGFQVNDAVTMLASGSSVFQVVATQGGQVYQVLSGANGGVGGALKSITGFLGSVATAGRLAFGGLAAAIGVAGLALSSYLDSQQKVQMSLLGAGRASGQSVSSINAVAQSSSSTTGLSTAEARAFAAELASVGKIGKDNLEPIVKIGHDIATVYGIDAAGAAQLLGKAFADPVSGAEQLNERLGFLDAAMQRNIANLVAQGRLQEAQKTLQAGVVSGLTGVSEAVSTSTKFWTAIGNAASNAWDKMGNLASRATGIGLTKGLDDQLKDARARLEELQKIAAVRSPAVNQSLGTTRELIV